MMIFFWASLANTIPATFWVLYYLLTSESGRAFEAIREEIVVHNGEMDKLKLVDSTINETLRLVGNIFLIRCTYKEDGTALELHDGRQLHIQPKDHVCYYPAISHYDETIFSAPRTFKYDRFLQLEKVPQAYMPFGNGKSICPGRFFVRNEIKIILKTLVTDLDLELVDFIDGETPQFRKECVGNGVMWPDRDVKVRYRYKN
jgi:cytochrome P450